MNRIWNDSEAAQEIINRLTSEDIMKLLIFVKMDVIEANDDGSVTVQRHDMLEDVLEDVDEPKLPYDKEALLKRYNSGDVIVLIEPDVALINAIRTDLGLWEVHESYGGATGKLEAYAFAYAEAQGLPNYFAYTIPKLADITSEDEVSDDEDAVVESEDTTPSYGARYSQST